MAGGAVLMAELPTDEQLFVRYRTAAQRARARVLELEMVDIATVLNPWLFGENNVLRAIEIIDARGQETVTSTEIVNLLYIAGKEPLLRFSCNLQGIPTLDEYMAERVGAIPTVSKENG
jgi:hypothetical protein